MVEFQSKIKLKLYHGFSITNKRSKFQILEYCKERNLLKISSPKAVHEIFSLGPNNKNNKLITQKQSHQSCNKARVVGKTRISVQTEKSLTENAPHFILWYL